MQDTEVDVVIVCTPSGTHCDLAMMAADAGKHVLVEKPLEVTDERMTRMIDYCQTKNVKMGVVFQRRAYESCKKVKQALEQGVLGKPILAQLSMKWYRSPEYYADGVWKGTWQYDGGGACMNQAVHGIDILLWLMGDVDSIFAHADHLVHDIEVEDTAVAVVKFKNGAFGSITATTSCNPGEEEEIALHGSKGTIKLAGKHITRWAIAGNEGDLAQDTEDMVSHGQAASVADPRAIDISGHTVNIDTMAQVVLLDTDPMCTGADARKSVDLILALYESARTGKEIQF